jgi:phenylpropionate dioxygenase-like ring-hydroxylating dioxygenase large terminal subunit
MYLKNMWYVAGFPDEIGDHPIARTLLEQPLVFFRARGGQIAALADRCPHRFAPLSKGAIVGPEKVIQCGYHGLQFDARGRCVHNPHGPIPQVARVPRYEVCERRGLLWLWGGDPEQADTTLIPDYGDFAEAPPDATLRGYLPTQCHYQLVVDNILDLTHADYLHAGGLGNGSLTRARPVVTDLSPRSLHVSWKVSGEPTIAAFDVHLREQGKATEQWSEVTWTAAGNMHLRTGATLLGEERSQGVEAMTLHLAVPETVTSTHYWYWSVRNFAISPEANSQIQKFIEFAFVQQDKPMLEAQQRAMQGREFWSLRPILLASDAGAVRARRKLDQLVLAEQEMHRHQSNHENPTPQQPELGESP